MIGLPQIVFGLASIGGVALSAVALARPPRGRLRWGFGLGMAAFALEALAGLMLTTYTDAPADKLLWLRIQQTAGLAVLIPWIFFAIALATPWWRPLPLLPTRLAGVLGLVAIAVSLAAWTPSAFDVADFAGAFHAVQLGVIGRIGAVLQILGTAAVLVGLEAALRSSQGEARWRTKYLVLGLGGIFLIRFYFLSQTALFNVLLASYITTMATTFVVGSAVVGVSLGRDRLGSELSVSRQVVYRSVGVGILGAYLMALGTLAWLLNRLGMPEELAWGSIIVFVSALALAAVMLSEAVRWRIKRFVAINFYRSKYDYREQWTSFTGRLGSLVTVDELAPELLQTMADAVGTRTGLLFLRDAIDGRYHAVAAVGTKAPASALDAASPIVARAHESREPVMLADGCPVGWLESSVAEAFAEPSVLVPLPWSGDCLGLIMLGAERTGAAYTAEDAEFLATAAQQAAGAVATAQISETLTRAREFEAFHRLTSFVVHDLKNSISALSMLSQNATRHIGDPEFQQDALKTLTRTVARMNDLLARLSSAPDTDVLRSDSVDLHALVHEVTAPLAGHDRVKLIHDLEPVPAVVADADALLRAIQNLVSNAVQSIPARGVVTVRTYATADRAVLEVSDTGCGMSEEFIRRSLFTPFRTTKRGGWGIGLYQTKSVLETYGGTIEVQSKEAVGTTFRVTLPATSGDSEG